MAELELSVYDVNKQAMAQQSPLDGITLNAKVAEMAQYIAKNLYTMLLNKENADYTIFHSSQNEHYSPDSARTTLWNTLHNRGRVLEVEQLSDGAFEIWLLMGNEAFVYYLFNYEEAVIEV